MSRISSLPTDGLTYNATEPKYWDREGLDEEVTRVFDICQGCRLCFNLCPSFPALFDAIDQQAGCRRSASHCGGETQRHRPLLPAARCARFDAPTRPAMGMSSSSISRA